MKMKMKIEKNLMKKVLLMKIKDIKIIIPI